MLSVFNKDGGKIKEIVFCPHQSESAMEELTTLCGCGEFELGLMKLLAIKWKLDVS